MFNRKLNIHFVQALGVAAALLNGQTVLAGPAVVTCASVDESGTSLKVEVIQGADAPPKLQVSVNSVLIYERWVSIENLPDRTVYQSAEFKNPRNAPTNLRLEVYPGAMGQTGQFSEISFLPMIGVSGAGMECK